MRRLLLLFIPAMTVAFTSEPDVLVHRLIVQPSSTLTIDGKTNVNKFSCAISQYMGTDTLVLREGGRNVKPVFTRGIVSLDASGFDCGMAAMTSDFHKTIRSKTFPAIVIEFILFERVPSYAYKEEKFKGIMKISLGGTTNLFEVDCTIEASPSGMIYLRGARNFKFSDFNLEPPAHMFGLVRVEDSLKVSFKLVLKLDANS